MLDWRGLMECLHGKVSVSRHKKTKNDENWSILEESEEQIEVPYFPDGTKNAQVSLGMEYTRQIKSFEPIKVSIHVSMPCHANESEVLKIYDVVSSIASSKMREAKQSLDALVNNVKVD